MKEQIFIRNEISKSQSQERPLVGTFLFLKLKNEKKKDN